MNALDGELGAVLDVDKVIAPMLYSEYNGDIIVVPFPPWVLVAVVCERGGHIR